MIAFLLEMFFRFFRWLFQASKTHQIYWQESIICMSISKNYVSCNKEDKIIHLLAVRNQIPFFFH